MATDICAHSAVDKYTGTEIKEAAIFAKKCGINRLIKNKKQVKPLLYFAPNMPALSDA